MVNLLVIGLGGFFGAIARYGLSAFVHRFMSTSFPYGTLAVNVAGCLALGGIMYFGEDKAFLSPAARAFFAMGLLGAFTTFSTFGHETLELVSSGRTLWAAANVTANVTLGIGALFAARYFLKIVGA